LGVSSTKSDPVREWMSVVSSLRRADVEYISRERVDAVLWKVRSSSLGSYCGACVLVLEYRPVETWWDDDDAIPLLLLVRSAELSGGGGSDWQRLKNSAVRSWDVIFNDQ